MEGRHLDTEVNKKVRLWFMERLFQGGPCVLVSSFPRFLGLFLFVVLVLSKECIEKAVDLVYWHFLSLSTMGMNVLMKCNYCSQFRFLQLEFISFSGFQSWLGGSIVYVFHSEHFWIVRNVCKEHVLFIEKQRTGFLNDKKVKRRGVYQLGQSHSIP